MQNRAWGNEYRMTLVCVDDYQDSILRGRLYNPYFSTGSSFQSLMEFLRRMEELLDEMQFPQSFTAVRAFGDPPQRKAASPPVQEVQEGKCATFSVRVLFAGISYLVGGQKGGELPQCTGTGPADGQCSARRNVQKSETGTRFSVMRCMTEDLCVPVRAHNRK